MNPYITESINPLTENIDVADPVGIARLLRQSDAQLFSGWQQWASLMDEEILEKLAHAGWLFSRHLANPKSSIVFSGAGTSGRLAHILALEYNRVLRDRGLPEVFKGLIAGGEPALIQAQESAEDDPELAVKDLKKVLGEETEQGLYVGITCGLSAPYVAAQLDYVGGNKSFHSIVLGFNPASGARDVEVEGWHMTVKDVLDAALESDRFLLLNPVYGPEPITGSTRMKGGSTTKILMDTAFGVALEILDNEKRTGPEKQDISEDNLLPLRSVILDILGHYREAIQAAYLEIDGLASLIRLGGTALRSAGRIHYLGRGTAAILGVIDASECPPTFGADLYDVRGYVLEGWEMYGHDNSAMKKRGKAYEIDHDYFENQVLPEIEKGDLVVAIAVGKVGENTRRLLAAAAKNKAHTALILITDEKPKATELPEKVEAHCVVKLPRLGLHPKLNNEAEQALKICLNALTTGAHIMAGKVYGNVMIDLRISNNKLYYRSINLITRLLGVSVEEARRALYQAVFRDEPTEEALEKTSIAAYISDALKRSKVIPLAILLATRKFTLSEAEERLASEPRVRRIIEDLLTEEKAPL